MSTTFEEACAYIDNLEIVAEKHGNEHTRECLRRLGDPDRAFRCVQVAGTNGKGSVCAFLSSVFRTGGIRHGMFISPHLVTQRERIRLDGEWITKEEFTACYREVRAVSEQMEAEGEGHPSYFEFQFLMAMVCFQRNRVQTAILETGLGGRLDATTANTDPYLSVITSIGLDHEEFLGDSLPQIAGEKAGILKAGIPVVYDAGKAECAAVIEEKAKELSCPTIPVDPDECVLCSIDATGITIKAKRIFDGEGELRIPIPAVYQTGNAAVALAAMETLRTTYPDVFGVLTKETIREGLALAVWPGRMEELVPGFIVDGAHNRDGVAAFTAAVRSLYGDEEVTLIFGVAADKAYPEMIATLANDLRIRAVVTTEIPGIRRAKADDTAGIFRECGVDEVIAIPDPGEAVERAVTLARGGRVFCVGSLYLAGEVIKYLKGGNDK